MNNFTIFLNFLGKVLEWSNKLDLGSNALGSFYKNITK